ncbi:MurR/RpiR family transcriptional regulator [Fusobacterium sp. FSA-380-WT-2B]|uniref:MurR/RpiR family transcriptional regulator n=1 Tax=Fusobacterium sp. FSA-380-WT-2B TaxID=2605786 RepID=UPI0012B4284A|nr:MurR/RpiR family transcriptional regulator [Fusobacterium sp. FSA-380-WT-2B]MSS60240.1 MurR/RpiR family transcriptional regulator [Fusobacterium sp. FSA-380-WT-2B]
MNKKSKLFLLDQLLPSFSPAEQKIALFILENTFAVIDMTIEDMSEKIGTSVASISRFTKKIGFENFYLLKLGIAKEFVNSSNKTISLNVNKNSNATDIYTNVAKTNSAILEESIEYFNTDKMEEISEIILNANHIYLFAMGASGILAKESWYKFIRLGLKCSIIEDFHSQLLQASILDDTDVALIFSHSGINKDVLTLLEIINETPACSIGITNYARTPFSQSVDICLFFSENSTPMDKVGFSSRIPQLIIIESLYRILSLKLGEKSKICQERYKRIFKKRSI